ncbi:flagellar biosynthesis protein FliQ [Solidesulfovibrio sp.]|jgi:flagellar biosynthetic protein FliQ|uniref:flagellar biosynthesis protein FliQ n=1 Tax=Solidesulfovibrio sp. TaxID=2910990 RepID=UPI002B2088C2|nr:flagellar biosynthesis protein FliQ [Solidesulfovibrio sp.]MEA5087869.1 flagellar biosynthesis protein FliQ [Solidesulfovibrio sp.]HML62291.1 flagellar biosynthesis protein FliQ [Solidesulfovibrio sp.]
MTPDMVVAISRQAIETALFLALPMLGVSLVVGVFISVLQAATQIQEMTLTFVPKILAMFIALLLAFPWMMDKMLNFTRELFMNIPTYLR